MARAAHTYRGARARAGKFLPLGITPSKSPIAKISPLQVMPEPKYRPVQPRGKTYYPKSIRFPEFIPCNDPIFHDVCDARDFEAMRALEQITA